jgi:hypothetical protein
MREASGPIAIKITDFTFQSFFDNTQQLQAILTQPQGQLIVASTVNDISLPGYGVGLHPDSMTPVAVQFKTNVSVPDTSTYFLTPGQTIWPHDFPFSGFRYGLPFGWLGGSTAHVLIFKTPDAKALWPQVKTEVAFHRFRIQIQADGASPTFQSSLPLRFPSPNVFRYNAGSPSSPYNQGGTPVMNVTPTRTVLKLRVSNLAAPADIRWLVQSPQYFSTSETVADQFTFPSVAGSAAYYPTVEFEMPTVLYGGNDSKIAVMDASGGTLAGQYIDVVRYGLI